MGIFDKSKTQDLRKLRAAGFSLAVADRMAQPRSGNGAILLVAGGILVALVGGIATLGLSLETPQTASTEPNPTQALNAAVNEALFMAKVDATVQERLAEAQVWSDAQKQPPSGAVPQSSKPAPTPGAPLHAVVLNGSDQNEAEPEALTQASQIDTATTQAAATPFDCVDTLAGFFRDEVIFFDLASVDLPATSADQLTQYVTRLNSCDTAVLQITGHSDSTGSDNLNLSLSWDRADNTRDALISMGADAATLEAVGFGARAPSAQGSTDDPAQDRRVEFRVTRKRTGT